MIFLMALLIPFGSVAAETDADKGLAIMIEADKRDKGWQDSHVELKMTLRNKQGKQSQRLIRVSNLEMDGDGDKGLTVFDEPRDIKGTAFLTFSHSLVADEQWIFLPAVKRIKRIASKNKSGPFMGSEFAFEDISSFEIPKYSYRYLRDDILDKLDCFVVEATPQYKYSGYKKIEIWVDKAEYRTQKIVFYDRKNSELKTNRFTDYHLYLDQYWRAHKMTMINKQSGKSTILDWSNFQFRTGLTAKDFEKNDLKRQR